LAFAFIVRCGGVHVKCLPFDSSTSEICHSERSEESLFLRQILVAIGMLRSAQHDIDS
jgi:hypothetical protein